MKISVQSILVFVCRHDPLLTCLVLSEFEKILAVLPTHDCTFEQEK